MSVYDHHPKPGSPMVKIGHGLTVKPEYLPFHGTMDEALTLEAESRQASRPAFLIESLLMELQ